MKKLLILMSLLLIPSLCYGSAPSRDNTYVTGETIDAPDVTANEDAIFNYLQAGVDTYATDSIKDTHIDWGTSGTQVSQDDVVDGGTYKQYNPASVSITGGTITGITDLTVSDGGTGVSTLSDGFVLLGNGTSAIQTLDVTGNGSIIIGDGTTDPTTLSAFTSSTGTLKHESGGLEADVSGYTNGLYGQLTGATANIDTSAEIISAISDETGTGNLVFSASPTLTGTITAASMNASGTVSGVVVSASSALQVGSDYISDITGSGLSISGGALKVTTTGESTTVSDTTTINLTLTGSDITADGLYTAGDALTLTGADFDFDGGATPGGELGNTWASPTIDDSVAVTSWNLTTPTITTSATMTDGATIGQAAGPLLAFDDTNNYFEMTGGNVGIGTTVPSNLLQVSKSDTSTTLSTGSAIASFRNTDTTDNNFVLFSFQSWYPDNTTFGGARFGAVFTDHTQGSGDASWIVDTIQNGTLGERLRVTNVGNVGIGTNAPGRLLDINGITRFRDAIYWGSTDAIGTITWSAGKFTVLPGSGYALCLGSNATVDRLVLDTGGNVGIGTVTPTRTLDVVGNIFASNTITGVIVDTQFIEYASGTSLTVRDNLIVYGDIKSSTIYNSFKATLAFPDLLQAEIDNWCFPAIEAEEFPNGITIKQIRLKTSASSSYSLTVENWSDPTTYASDIGTVATSTSTEAVTNVNASVSAGSIIQLDLPTTDIGWIEVQVYYLKQ